MGAREGRKNTPMTPPTPQVNGEAIYSVNLSHFISVGVCVLGVHVPRLLCSVITIHELALQRSIVH